MSKKTAIVTGASAGIGKATAILLHKQGYQVVAGARRLSHMQDLAAQGILTHVLDVTEPKSNQDFMSYVMDHSQSIDVIVNSAGYGSQGALEDVTSDEANNQFDVNVFGLMNLTQLVLPVMRKQRSGKIVKISSGSGQIYAPLSGWYTASKHALEALSDTLRLELKPFDIDVLIIEPGPTKTEWGDIAIKKLIEQTPKNSAYHKLVQTVAHAGIANFSATPEQIAQLILKSIKSRRPKTRYQPSLSIKMLVIAARKLSYKQFDRMVNRQLSGMMKH